MNKTITINLAGINFYIDEDAYYKLDRYLKTISASLDPESRVETMQDIEARIAELLLEDQKEKTEVVTMATIDKVIAIMGQPSDYVDEDGERTNYTSATSGKSHKKLYRDLDRKIIGGVCGGLSHYFNIDVIWIRLALILLLFPFGIWFKKLIGPGIYVGNNLIFWSYIILWIITPGARSTRQKLEMQGEKVNVDNIERKVKENFTEDRRNSHSSKETSDDSTKVLKDILSFTGIFIAKSLGIIMVMISGTALLALLFSLVSSSAFTISGASWIDYVNAADIGVPFWMGTFMVFLLIAIPVFYIFWLGLKILVTRISLGTIGNSLLIGLWIISLFTLGGLAIRQATIRAFNHNSTEVVELDLENPAIMQLGLMESSFKPKGMSLNNNLTIVEEDKDKKRVLSGDIYFQFKIGSEGPYLEIVKYSKGKSSLEARENVERMEYDFEIDGDRLLLSDYFITDIKNLYKDQKIRLNLYLPEDMIFNVDEDFSRLSRTIPRNYYKKDLMIENGTIICLDCPEVKEKEDENKAVENQIQSEDSIWYEEKS